MENAQEKCLTLEEKEKIKERLALLKKEYRRTVNRLQRSQRAERVKTHVKKTVEEQNRLLSQERAVSDVELAVGGLVGSISNASGNTRESQDIVQSSSSVQERKASVTFKLEPEIVHADSRTPPCSGGESSGQEAEANGASCSTQVSRSRLRLSRSTRRVCFSESPSPNVFRLSGMVNAPDGQEKDTLDRSLSPVFKKCPSDDDDAIKQVKANDSYCLEGAKNVDLSSEVTEVPGNGFFRLGTADNSPGGVKKECNTLKREGLQTDLGIVPVSKVEGSCLYRETNRLEITVEQPLRKTGFPTIQMEEPFLVTQPDRLETTEGTPINKVEEACLYRESERLETTEDQPLVSKSSSLEEHDATRDHSVTPTGTLKVENHTNLKPATNSQSSSPISIERQNLSNHVLKEEDHNPLNSCTLVEGLLFPVEYYIRTTRRMTSCQRKVDLDAVISSHLGTARKGSRRTRRNSSALSTPHDTQNASLTPLSCPLSKGAMQSRRGRGRKSCPARISSGLKDVSVKLQFGAENCLTPSSLQSEKENCEETSASKKEANRNIQTLTDITDSSRMEEKMTSSSPNKKRFGPSSQGASSFSLLSTTHVEEGKLGSLQSLGEATDSPASSFPCLDSRVSLAYLACRLGITDFHLPDEDFGILKLEKIKSVNCLEVFVPLLPRKAGRRRSRQHCKNESTPSPSAGGTAVVQEAENTTGPLDSESDFNRLQRNKQCLKDRRPAHNKEDTLENCEEPIFTAEPTCVLPLQRSPVKTELMSSNKLPDDAHRNRFGFFPEQPVTNTEMSKPFTTTPTRHLDNGAVPVGDSCEEHTEPPRLNLAAHTNVETKAFIKSSIVPNEPADGVLFSTSLCSVPLESTNESVNPSCTPRYPYLGSTPAVLSIARPLTPSSTKEEQVEHPHPELCREDGVGSHHGIAVSGERMDTHQSSDTLEKYDNVLTERTGKSVEDREKQNGRECDDNDNAGEIDEMTKKNNDEELEAEEGGHLHLVSKIQEDVMQDGCSGGGCAVDLCSVWWEFSGNPELCVVSANESSVRLWRLRVTGTWERVHTWSFMETPVIQLLPLGQEKNILCVALGNLEIGEIWAVFSPQESLGSEKQLVKRGHTKTARGLSGHRLVSSGRVGDSPVVEVYQLSELGCTVRSLRLTPPRDSVLAFCEPEGERDALIGSTTDNYVVVWNTVTGHLLSVIWLGELCSDLICLSAFSDSGILFLLVGSLLSSQCEATGSCVFRLIAANPRTGTSALIMSYVIPDRPNSRYLEGDVNVQSMAAVLTCGSIALWDLRRSRFSVRLPPSTDAPWCLVRWGHKPSCLLTGQKDGTISVFEYRMCRSK